MEFILFKLCECFQPFSIALFFGYDWILHASHLVLIDTNFSKFTGHGDSLRLLINFNRAHVRLKMVVRDELRGKVLNFETPLLMVLLVRLLEEVKPVDV